MKKLLIITFVLCAFSSAMAAEFTITIPNDKIELIKDSFASRFAYQATIEDQDGNVIPNPESKVAFAKRQIRIFIRETVIAAKVKIVEDGRDAAVTEGETETENIIVE